MTDPKKEQEWADEIPDEEERNDEYEPVYRDGSAQNECWAGDELWPRLTGRSGPDE